jgi:hypothetical protein
MSAGLAEYVLMTIFPLVIGSCWHRRHRRAWPGHPLRKRPHRPGCEAADPRAMRLTAI